MIDLANGFSTKWEGYQWVLDSERSTKHSNNHPRMSLFMKLNSLISGGEYFKGIYIGVISTLFFSFFHVWSYLHLSLNGIDIAFLGVAILTRLVFFFKVDWKNDITFLIFWVYIEFSFFQFNFLYKRYFRSFSFFDDPFTDTLILNIGSLSLLIGGLLFYVAKKFEGNRTINEFSEYIISNKLLSLFSALFILFSFGLTFFSVKLGFL